MACGECGPNDQKKETYVCEACGKEEQRQAPEGQQVESCCGQPMKKKEE
ncbi:MAG: desulforedoxin [Candidatus Omnitrophica bacterium]|nr:desulforedoxin [Candidatus Omnitrophota bacterium]